MSKEKRKKFSHGGARENAGRPKTGITKKKICVSIDRHVWQAARTTWAKNASRLIETLVAAHVKQSEANQNMEAMT